MKALKLVKKFYYPFTPVLFSIAFVSAQFYAWFNAVYIKSIFLPTVSVIVIVPIVFYLFRLLLRDRTKGELFTTMFLILFFSYSAISNLSWNIVFTLGHMTFGKDEF